MQPNQLPLDVFTKALHESWGSDTCFDASEWSEQNPARGHCVASSLVVQDYYGGDLIRYHVTFVADGREEMHYCNELPDKTELDTTGMQYQWPVIKQRLPIDLKGFATIREKRMADDDTRRRYEILAKRVIAKLEESYGVRLG